MFGPGGNDRSQVYLPILGARIICGKHKHVNEVESIRSGNINNMWIVLEVMI